MDKSGLRNLLGIFVFSVLFGFAFYKGYPERKPPLYPLDWKGLWIKYPYTDEYKSFFRKTFFVARRIKNAYLRISADNDYTVFLNNQVLGRDLNLGSNTASFQGGLTEEGQKVGSGSSFPVKNPPEAQWTSSPDWRVACFYDITPYIKSGKNVLAVAVQTDRKPARLLLEAYLQDMGGKVYKIVSDQSWKVNRVEETKKSLAWFKIDFDASRWLPGNI